MIIPRKFLIWPDNTELIVELHTERGTETTHRQYSTLNCSHLKKERKRGRERERERGGKQERNRERGWQGK